MVVDGATTRRSTGGSCSGGRGLIAFRRRRSSAASSAGRPTRGARGSSTTVAADPDVAFVVDGDAVVGIGPFVALSVRAHATRATPVSEQVALLIELEDRGRGQTAFRGRRVARRRRLLWVRGCLRDE